jgi:hypothetical protein
MPSRAFLQVGVCNAAPKKAFVRTDKKIFPTAADSGNLTAHRKFFLPYIQMLPLP